ncbi:MAG: undecaprenyl/decaprenyl-phosphate alpha-N-acetylglucosaminyl 1-phosphate transferase, partial [Candidatus Paceibacteria bacterium]
GSMFLGLMLAVLAMISGGKIATAALVLAFPIIDAMFVIFRRIRAGASIFQADNRHFHHQLLRFGFSQRQAVLFLYGVSLLFGILALTLHTQGKFFTFLAGMVALAVLSGVISWKKER